MNARNNHSTEHEREETTMLQQRQQRDSDGQSGVLIAPALRDGDDCTTTSISLNKPMRKRGRTHKSAGASCLAVSACIIVTFLTASSLSSSSLSSSSSSSLPLLFVSAEQQHLPHAPMTTKDDITGKTTRGVVQIWRFDNKNFGGEDAKKFNNGAKHKSGSGVTRRREMYDRFDDNSGSSSSESSSSSSSTHEPESTTRFHKSNRYSETREKREQGWRASTWTWKAPSSPSSSSSSSSSSSGTEASWSSSSWSGTTNSSTKSGKSTKSSKKSKGKSTGGSSRSSSDTSTSSGDDSTMKPTSRPTPPPATSTPTSSLPPTSNVDDGTTTTPRPATDNNIPRPDVPSRPSPTSTGKPTDAPSFAPSLSRMPVMPTPNPTDVPSAAPTGHPSASPTVTGSDRPSASPTIAGSSAPSVSPSEMPSSAPTVAGSERPSASPSAAPSAVPTMAGSDGPSASTSEVPSPMPSIAGSTLPSNVPSEHPSDVPSDVPSERPSDVPSIMPSDGPSSRPSGMPSSRPSHMPSDRPSSRPSAAPSSDPSSAPSELPTSRPSPTPSSESSAQPSTASSEGSTDAPTTLRTYPPSTTTGDPNTNPPVVASLDPPLSPPPKTDLQMDLFGLASLPDADVLRYARQTAAFVEDFYNDDLQQRITKASVSRVVASVAVTNQIAPGIPPPTTSTSTPDDCDTIDPLTMTFTMELTYYASEPAPALDDVIAFPFSKKRSRTRYINAFLKEGDASGEFANLSCVSEIRIPDAGVVPPGPSPTTTTTTPESSQVPTAGETVPVTPPSVSIPTSSPTMGGSGTPPEGKETRIAVGVEMDLFGIPSALASPPDREHYEAKTMRYLDAFYNEGSKQQDLRAVVSGVTTTLGVTGQTFPTGNVSGEDCDLISPLTVTFTVEMTYSTTDPAVPFGEIVALPFSKKRLQKKYMDEYLTVDDVTGVFQALKCVGELRFNGGGSGPSVPTTTTTNPPFLGGIPTAPTGSPVRVIPATGPPIRGGLPVVSPTTPPIDAGGSITPPPRSDIEMDLFGLVGLTSTEISQYQAEMASYIELFYNDNSDQADIRAEVTVLATSIEVTGQVSPTGSFLGEDCDLIDPMTATFTLAMAYATSNPDVIFDEIITSPFLKKRLRKKFVDQMKENNPGSFQFLQCVSELRLPGGGLEQALLKTLPTSPPGVDLRIASPPTASATPTSFTDDIFYNLRSGDVFNDLSLSDQTTERKCSEKLHAVPQENVEEFEMSFVYGVESTTSNLSLFIDSLENVLLNFVATSVLTCHSGNHAVAVRLRRREDGDSSVAGEVVRIRYPIDGQITSISKCDPTSSGAGGCAVLITRLLVTVTTTIGSDASVAPEEIHRDVLVVLQDAFDANVFTEFIPEVVSSRYLGPDPSAIATSATGTEGMGGPTEHSSYKAVGLVFSVSCAVLLVKLAACASVPRAGNAAPWEKIASIFGYKGHEPLLTDRN